MGMEIFFFFKEIVLKVPRLMTGHMFILVMADEEYKM